MNDKICIMIAMILALLALPAVALIAQTWAKWDARKQFAMSCFDRWMMKRIAKRNVVQGYDARLDEMFAIIRAEADVTYTEDNMVTLDSYMHDHFEKTQKTTWSQPCQQCKTRQPVEIKGQVDQTDAWGPAFGDGTCSHILGMD